MGGRIAVVSAPGAGSVFEFAVSFARSAQRPLRPRESAREPEMQPLAGIRVLLAEDNLVNQELALEILDSAGATVITASTGRAAVHLASHGDFDCILMDIEMPELDGYAATAQIRQHATRGNVTIVAMTAHAESAYREECRKVGMDDFVTKPIDASELIDVLVKWIGPRDADAVAAPEAKAASSRLPENLPGIDMRAALARANGNHALLRRLLQLFASEYGNAPELIDSAIARADWETACRLAHTIIGSAGIFPPRGYITRRLHSNRACSAARKRACPDC